VAQSGPAGTLCQQVRVGCGRAALSGLLVLFFAFLARPVHAGETILWLKTEWPPVFMTNGKGFGDQAMVWLIERLPDYKNNIRSVPLARLLRTLDHTDEIVCASGLARTPTREAQFLVSADLMHMPGLALVTRADDIEVFHRQRNAAGAIELRRLLQQGNLDGAIHESRSYGAALDEVLRAAPANAPLVRLTKTNSMLSMLGAKRVDWLLLYPFEATWQAKQEDMEMAIVSLPVAEVPASIRGGITCNRVPGSAAVIEKINTLIGSHPDRPWLGSMMEWLDPEARRRQATGR
jgi:uncharacterized protein (TIGR02285 family)